MKNIIIKNAILISSSRIFNPAGDKTKLVLTPSLYWKVSNVRINSRDMANKIKETIFGEKIPQAEKDDFIYKTKKRGQFIDFYAINISRIDFLLKTHNIEKEKIKWVYLLEEIFDIKDGVIVYKEMEITNCDEIFIESKAVSEISEDMEIEASRPFMLGFVKGVAGVYSQRIFNFAFILVVSVSIMYVGSVVKKVFEVRKNISEIKAELGKLGVPSNNIQLQAVKNQIQTISKENGVIVSKLKAFGSMNLQSGWEYDEFKIDREQIAFSRKGRELGVVK